jgi:hypothetical protein
VALSRDLLLVLTRDAVLQELNRRAVAERGVAATSVVEHFDIVEQVGDGLCTRGVARAVHRSFFRLLKELSVGGFS